jgi:hypothetical protein
MMSVLSAALILGVPLLSVESMPLDPHLEPFRPFLGKTWRGVFANSTPEKPMVDVSRYERAMNGKAVRTLHSINDGEYGGETLIYWDAEKKSLAFFYLTTAGFRTEGTMTADAEGFASIEEVKGNASGITKVKGVAKITGPGKMRVTAEYFKEGAWVPGRTTDYVESPTSEVVFK